MTTSFVFELSDCERNSTPPSSSYAADEPPGRKVTGLERNCHASAARRRISQTAKAISCSAGGRV